MPNKVAVRFLITVSRLSAWLSRIAAHIAKWIDAVEYQKFFVSKSSYDYNMLSQPNEVYYRRFYFNQLDEYIEQCDREFIRVLDLGCGQGRFLDYFSSINVSVFYTGVDYNIREIEAVWSSLNDDNNALSCSFVESGIVEYVTSACDESFDLILFNEVAFFLPNWPQLLLEFRRLLSPGGALQISQRSSYFSAACYVKNRFEGDLDFLDLCSEGSGRLFEGGPVFTWDTRSSFEAKIGSAGFGVLDIVGIGPLSGIPEDIHSGLCEPSNLDSSGIEGLFLIENFYGKLLPEVSRYMSILCVKHG